MQYRILSVSLDGYMNVFDYVNMKVTHSMRFPAPLMSVALSPHGMTRVIGTSNESIYAGRKKKKENVESRLVNFWSLGSVGKPQKRLLRPTYFRYFQRGQNEKPNESDYLVVRPKKLKLGEHDKLLKKFSHKDALVCVLSGKNWENVVALMEELMARGKLLKCASNLDDEGLGLLLSFLQKHSTTPRYSGLMGLMKKVLETRAEDTEASDILKNHIRNLKRSVEEETRIQVIARDAGYNICITENCWKKMK